MEQIAASSVRRAAMANLGCKVNQSEMNEVERLLRAHRVEIVGAGEPADLVVVNTCTVTSMADQKSRQAVRRARRASPDARLIVTGCSVSIDPAKLAETDPAAILYDNESKDRMLAELEILLALPDGLPLPTMSGVERVADAWTGGTPTDIDHKRAIVKIQDGCSFRCTYCVIPQARGPERSVPADTVIGDVRRAVAAGHREVVLTGINAGTYGGHVAVQRGVAGQRGVAPPAGGVAGQRGVAANSPSGAAAPGLAALVSRILAETRVERIRLSSIEPQHVTAELLAVWASSGGRCMPHFHVPLQSGDDTILRRMGRRYTAAEYVGVVAAVRRAIPGAAVHADVIVGFPGEDEAAFERTARLLRALEPAGIHVFRYSARRGTAAARMVGRVEAPVAARRAAELLALAADARVAFATNLLAGELRVLFERPLAGGWWLGHDEHHVEVAAPSPDGRPLANVLGVVLAESVDRDTPGRIAGRVVSVVPQESLAPAPLK